MWPVGTGVAKRRRGVEWHSGGVSDPRRDRPAGRSSTVRFFFRRTFLEVGIPYFDIFLLLCLECPRASLRESPMCSLKIKSVGSAPPRTFLKSGLGLFCLPTYNNKVIPRAFGPLAFYGISFTVFSLKTPASFAYANLQLSPKIESPTRYR